MVKEAKSKLWRRDGTLRNWVDRTGLGIPVEEEEGIMVLGSPMGSEEFIRKEIRRRIDKIEELTEKLAWLEDSHMEFVLLRNCLALPKMMYVLRTCGPPTLCRRMDLVRHYHQGCLQQNRGKASD